MRFDEVDPNSFIDSKGEPEHGRGCWVRTGIDFDYRYSLAPSGQNKIGTVAQKSLAYWSVAIGCFAIQKRLVALDLLPSIPKAQRGIFSAATRAAVLNFQDGGRDPDGGAALSTDGTVGKSDARALFTPIILDSEKQYGIPDRLLLGEMYHESQLDPGAVGYFIYYPDYRGVDRGIAQINSKAHTEIGWGKSFDVEFAADWSAERMRAYFDGYKKKYPQKSDFLLWDAAVCSHNNPSAGASWASTGFPSTSTGGNLCLVSQGRKVLTSDLEPVPGSQGGVPAPRNHRSPGLVG